MAMLLTRTEVCLPLSLSTQSLVGEEFDNGVYLVYKMTSLSDEPHPTLEIVYRGTDGDKGSDLFRDIAEVLCQHKNTLISCWINPEIPSGMVLEL